MAALSFLDLPGELRNQIYNAVLTDVVEQSRHDMCKPEASKSTSDYLNFLLTCRQISFELGDRFRREYAHRLNITFTHTTKLSAFVNVLHSNPQSPIAQSRFTLCNWAQFSDPKCGENTLPKPNTQSVEVFLQAQPGFRSMWIDQPGLHETEPNGWNETDLATMQRLGIPDYDFEPWNAADEGFVSSKGDHSKCKSSTTCLQYTQLSWPLLDNKCQLTTYSWTTPSLKNTCIVLEGRLCDLYSSKHETAL